MVAARLSAAAAMLLSAGVAYASRASAGSSAGPAGGASALPASDDVLAFLLLKSPRLFFLCACGYALHVALKVRALGPRSLFWGASFLKVLVGAFGGGICVPLALGKPPGPFANDAVVTSTLIAWWIAHRAPSDLGFKLLGPGGPKPLRLCVHVCFEVFRANFIVSMVLLAQATLKPSLFSIPLWGPVLAGSMGGSFGQFLPFDKGLGPVEKGFNWVMLSAFATALSVHLLLHYPPLSEAAWPALSAKGSPDESLCRLAAVSFLAGTAIAQETLMGPDWHPLQPITALLSKLVPPVLADGPFKKKAS